MKQLLVVFSNPRAGREEEFNDWYSNVHIRDVMRSCRGAIAVQRFMLAAEQRAGAAPHYRYLAIYEGDDHQGFTDGHKVIFSPQMPISEAFDFEDYRAGYYEPMVACKTVAGPETAGDVIVERMPAEADHAAFARAYAETRFPLVMKEGALQSGRFAVGAAHQLFKLYPDSQYLALYRTADRRRSLKSWPDQPQGEIACYTPITERVTVYDALNPAPEQKEKSETARARVGKGFQPKPL
jgi:hypothetical protein